MVYYSEDTHYSVMKILRVLNMRSIMIKSLVNGEIDYEDLYHTIQIHRDTPPIIFANIGTTMKGAIDDLVKIKKILRDLAIHEYYIHADCALSGMILPFVEHPNPFCFADGIHSMSISGHKMIGSPIPCGLAMANKDHVKRIARSVEYVGILDTTLTGSRNGITPLFLWYAIRKLGHEGFKTIIRRCMETSEYAIQCFDAIGVKAWKNQNSITVVFPRPSDELIKRWQLASCDEIAHIITMPQVTREKIDIFIKEYQKDRNENNESL